jgi:hypothetical protein
MDQKNLSIYGNDTIPWSRPLVELEKMTLTTAFGVATAEPTAQPAGGSDRPALAGMRASQPEASRSQPSNSGPSRADDARNQRSSAQPQKS